MIMKKNKAFVIIISMFLLLNNCGYTPVFLGTNTSFKIEGYEINGNKKIGNSFIRKINNFNRGNEDVKKIYLRVDSRKQKIESVKDETGKVSIYKIQINISLQAKYINSDNYFSTENLTASLNYKNQDKESDNILFENKAVNDMINQLSQNYTVRLNQILN